MVKLSGFKEENREGADMNKRIVITLVLILAVLITSFMVVQACKPANELECSLED